MPNGNDGNLGFQIANPKALGFAALAIPFWMYSMAWAGWFSTDVFGTGTALDAAILSTYALLVAALASFLRGETWHAVFFMFWTAYGWAAKTQVGESSPEAFSGFFAATIAVFSLILTWRAFQDQAVTGAQPLFALGASLAFLSWALAMLGVAGIFGAIGGYIGLLTALVGFWVATTELIGAPAETVAA